jgi:hypothetical protein
VLVHERLAVPGRHAVRVVVGLRVRRVHGQRRRQQLPLRSVKG